MDINNTLRNVLTDTSLLLAIGFDKASKFLKNTSLLQEHEDKTILKVIVTTLASAPEVNVKLVNSSTPCVV